MLLNEISVSDNPLGQLKIVTTNVQIMTLFGLKRIVKSCLVQNNSYYCAIPNCYVCQLRLQPTVRKHEYIKGTSRYQLAMLLKFHKMFIVQVNFKITFQQDHIMFCE